MKVTVQLPIDEKTRILVDTGDRIDPSIPVFEKRDEENLQSIPVAKIFKINPVFLPKFLKKGIGEKLSEGDIIAEKKGLFSSYQVKSPGGAMLKEIDLKTGDVVLIRNKVAGGGKVCLPVTGKVKAITKTCLEIEVDGEMFQSKRGKGADVTAKLHHISGENVGILSIDSDSNGKIVMCISLLPESSTKLEAIGAVGLIAQHVPDDKELELPFLEVEKEVYNRLLHHTSRHVWLRPESREIIVLNE
ncbi:hypothetical protein M1271_00735 [Patescibacteria group bacterium]|nr:hypothetical protein [Patescibacteria group bacterium]MCL5797544.1 hypothetical protein [Patescibacteria group bacterium]